MLGERKISGLHARRSTPEIIGGIGWESVLKKIHSLVFGCTFKFEKHKERQRRIKTLGVARGRLRVFDGTQRPRQNNQG